MAVAGAAFLWIVYQGLTWDLRGDETDPEANFRAHAVERDDRRLHLLSEVDENDIAHVRVAQAAEVRASSSRPST